MKNELIRRIPLNLENLQETKAYLEDMAEKGWILTEKKESLYLFKRCEPKKINFAVELFDKSYVGNNKYMEYMIKYEEAGWRFLFEKDNVYFFCTEDLSLKPIKIDDKIKFKIITDWKKKNNQILNIILVIIFIRLIMKYIIKGDKIAESFSEIFALILAFLIIFLVIINEISNCLWKRKCLKSIDEGNGLILKRHIKQKYLYILLGVITLIWSVLSYFAWLKFGQIIDLMMPIAFLISLPVFPMVLLKQKNEEENSKSFIIQILPFLWLTLTIIILVFLMMMLIEK